MNQTRTPAMMQAASRGAPRAALVLAAAVAIALALFWMLDAISSPWAVSLTSPTLPGLWQPKTELPTGGGQLLLLELRAEDAGRHGNLKVLGARARWCGPQGTRTYDGTTRPSNWRGTRFSMRLVATDGLEGLAFLELAGEWDRRDEIRAQVRFKPGSDRSVVANRDGTHTRPGAHSDSYVAIPLTLHRGQTSELSACTQPAAQRSLP